MTLSSRVDADVVDDVLERGMLVVLDNAADAFAIVHAIDPAVYANKPALASKAYDIATAHYYAEWRTLELHSTNGARIPAAYLQRAHARLELAAISPEHREQQLIDALGELLDADALAEARAVDNMLEREYPQTKKAVWVRLAVRMRIGDFDSAAALARELVVRTRPSHDFSWNELETASPAMPLWLAADDVATARSLVTKLLATKMRQGSDNGQYLQLAVSLPLLTYLRDHDLRREARQLAVRVGRWDNTAYPVLLDLTCPVALADGLCPKPRDATMLAFVRRMLKTSITDRVPQPGSPDFTGRSDPDRRERALRSKTLDLDLKLERMLARPDHTLLAAIADEYLHLESAIPEAGSFMLPEVGPDGKKQTPRESPATRQMTHQLHANAALITHVRLARIARVLGDADIYDLNCEYIRFVASEFGETEPCAIPELRLSERAIEPKPSSLIELEPAL